MSIDQNKLSPAPWKRCSASQGKCPCKLLWSQTEDCVIIIGVEADDDDITCGKGTDRDTSLVNLDFAAMARNFADVCGRLHCGVRKSYPGRTTSTNLMDGSSSASLTRSCADRSPR